MGFGGALPRLHEGDSLLSPFPLCIRLSFPLLIIQFLLHCAAAELTSGGMKTLIIRDGGSGFDSYSQFVDGVKADGQQVTIKSFDDSNLSLTKYGEYVYDNVVVLAPSLTAFKSPKRSLESRNVGGVDVKGLAKFLDDGGNIFLVLPGSSPVGTDLMSLASECGVTVEKETPEVVDFASSRKIIGKGGGAFTAIEAPFEVPEFLLVGDTYDAGGRRQDKQNRISVLYRGKSLRMSSPSSTLTFPILKASPTALGADVLPLSAADPHSATAFASPAMDPSMYSSSVSPASAGAASPGEVSLVVAMQARNSARCTVAGSAEMFSDEFISRNPANLEFARAVAMWTFHRRGKLRLTNIQHRLAEAPPGTPPPYLYRIKDYIRFEVDVEELRGDKWVPYGGNDVQLQFTMMDPFILTFLDPPPPGSSTYSKTFRAPDRHGIFKFVISHQRLGFDNVHTEILAPLRTFKHSDWPRFRLAAAPYYAAAGCVLVGLLVISILFLFHDEKTGKKGKKGV